MRAVVETKPALPVGFRPVHPDDILHEWANVPVRVRDVTGVVLGGVKNKTGKHLFVKLDSGSAWLREGDVQVIDHSAEKIGIDEPEGGWVAGQDLFNTEISTVLLCKYTVMQPTPGLECIFRRKNQHPDEDCLVFYHSADALRDGRIEITTDEDMPIAERVSVDASGTPTFQEPIS